VNERNPFFSPLPFSHSSRAVGIDPRRNRGRELDGRAAAMDNIAAVSMYALEPAILAHDRERLGVGQPAGTRKCVLPLLDFDRHVFAPTLPICACGRSELVCAGYDEVGVGECLR